MSGPRAIAGGEEGFTLIEMIVTTTILAIIVVPLTGAIILGLKNTDKTESLVATSAGRQFLSIYLPPDVASGTTVNDSGTTPAPATGCAGPNANPGSHVLRLTWREWEPPSTVETFTAAYRKVAVAGTSPPEYQLVRIACTDDGDPTEIVVARALHDVTATVDAGKVTATLTDATDTNYVVSASRRVP